MDPFKAGCISQSLHNRKSQVKIGWQASEKLYGEGMKKPIAKHPVFKGIRIVVTVYVGLVLFLFLTQQRMIYYPESYSREAGIEMAAAQGLELWEADNVFHGWKDQGDGGSAVLIFHGNAGGAVRRDYLRDLFRNTPASRDVSVYIFEYPGYGFRDGSPGEEAFREAAAKAHAALQNAYDSVYLLGESIGGGVATWLAGEKGADGVLLITPFNRLSAVASAHYPWLPVRWLLRDRYRNDEHLQNFDGPVAFVVAGQDAIIPSRLARKLYESHGGPKLWRLQESADHNTIYFGPGAGFWEEVIEFVTQ